MKFGKALKFMRAGVAVRRHTWAKGVSIRIELVAWYHNFELRLTPRITDNEGRHVNLGSDDILADDWMIA